MLSLLLSASVAALSPAAADPSVTASSVYAGADIIVVNGKYFDREITTATKTPTPLINVPQSITVLTERQIDEQAFLSIADVSRFTPGLSVGQGEGHRDQITIRGQNTTADFFVDGIRDDVQYFRPLYNVESVEVLRGSNALIFGRGGGGGVVNRTTKKAELGETFVGTSTSADTFGSFYQDVDVNTGAGERSAFRLNAFYEHLENHRDVYEGDRFAFNPTFTTELTPQTDLVVSYEYVDDERVVDRGVPSLDDRPLTGVRETFFGDPDLNKTTLAAHIARARVDHRISDALSFNTTVQYADYDKLYQNTYSASFNGDTNEVTMDGYRDTTARQNFIVQSNLIGEFETGGVGHTLLVGAEYADQKTDNARNDAVFAATDDDQITFLFTDPVAAPEVTFDNLVRNRDSGVEVFSLYLQDQIDLGEQVKIVGGLRYDRFDIEVKDFIEIFDGDADGNDGLLGSTDEEISPRVGLIYKPIPEVSVYGSYSKSFLPRAGDQFLTLSPSTQALDPEEFENQEVGVKWNITPELSVSAALFQLDRDTQTTDPENPEDTILLTTRTKGVEIQLTGEVMPNWHLTGGYSYLDAEDRDTGLTLAQVPEHMFSVWNRWDVNDRLGLSLGVAYQSEQFTSLSNAVELDSFTRVDAAVDYALTDNMALQLNVENLLDEEFFTDAHNDNNITPGEPLNARLTLSTRF